MISPRVIILGGYGTFGSLIAEQLARSDAKVLIAGRDPMKAKRFADALQAGFVQCDLRSRTSLQDTVSGAYLLINAAGPFQAKDYSIPEVCIAQGCHYIDLGDGREYVSGVTELHERARAQRVFVCVGASTTPAVTFAAVSELRSQVQRIRSIKVALTAGNKIPAGASTIASILSYVGLLVRVWQGGRWREITGWGLGEFIDFPPPVGRRRVQLCDVPDLELFPQLFAADNVIFKAGLELTLFNYTIAGLARLRRPFPALKLPRLARPLVSVSKLFKWLGTFHGSVAVMVADDTGQERSLALVAPQNGPRVPCAPAVLLARKLIAGWTPEPGAYPCIGFIELAEFAEHLKPFDVFVVRGKNGKWVSH
jgi:hypothetical protein